MGSGVVVSFVTSSASSVLYLVGSVDSSKLLLLFILSVMHIDIPSVETSELLVSLFDVDFLIYMSSHMEHGCSLAGGL